MVLKRYERNNMPYKDKEKQLKYMREYRKNGYHILHTYSLSQEVYQEMFNRQEGKCAICGKPFDENNVVHIDHNHKTGKVRGLLCMMCNCGIGHFNDNKELLLKAIEYLGSIA